MSGSVLSFGTLSAHLLLHHLFYDERQIKQNKHIVSTLRNKIELKSLLTNNFRIQFTKLSDYNKCYFFQQMHNFYIRGWLFSSWSVHLGCHFFGFDPILMDLYVNAHKLVLVLGVGI